jgi:hypothetical protein
MTVLADALRWCMMHRLSFCLVRWTVPSPTSPT